MFTTATHLATADIRLAEPGMIPRARGVKENALKTETSGGVIELCPTYWLVKI